MPGLVEIAGASNEEFENLDDHFDLQRLGQLHPVLGNFTDRIASSDGTIDIGSYESGQYRITARTTLWEASSCTKPIRALAVGEIVTAHSVKLVGENINAQVSDGGHDHAWCTLAIPTTGTRFAEPVKKNRVKAGNGDVCTVVRKRVRVLASASPEAATVCWLKQGEWAVLSCESVNASSWWALVTRPVTGWIELARVADGLAIDLAAVRGRLCFLPCASCMRATADVRERSRARPRVERLRLRSSRAGCRSKSRRRISPRVSSG
jgi:hypothetical protein